MTRLATLLCIITFSAGLPAMADGQWTWIGANGGTASGAGDCSASGGSYTCTGQTTYIGPEGRTTTRTRLGTGTATAGQRSVTTTGPAGETRTRNSTWQRSN
jgi:hypothetical protein